MNFLFLGGASALAFASLTFVTMAHAADTEPQAATPIRGLTVTGQRTPEALKTVPAVVATVTATQIRDSVNALTSAETLKYLPSIEVRERSIGDRNGIVSTRTTGTISSAESLVYADGVLISNLLGNSYSYPPRWGLVAPSEIDRVDVIYGPYSALYPGNSMGGVINLTTRTPDGPRLHIGLVGALENFNLYGAREHNGSGDLTIAAGDRIGPLTVSADFDHLDAQGHPLSFSSANLSTRTATGAATVVTGADQDLDQNGNPRLVFGAYSIDHTVQDQGKIKLGYDLSPGLRLDYTLGLWSDLSNQSVQSFLTNTSTGAAFYNGAVNIGGKAYTVSGLNPSNTRELQVLNAVTLSDTSGGTLDWKLSASDYDFATEHARSASNFGLSNAGTDQIQDGTGWRTGDAQAVWRPANSPLGRQEISFGYHYDAYNLRQTTYATTAWLTGPTGARTSASTGDTQTQALYVQDAWAFAPLWTLTVGGREEYWSASDGSNFSASLTPNRVGYPSQNLSDFSPKAALAFTPGQNWTSRFSFGRAVRYPTVTELYQQVSSGTVLVQNNPDLKPEDVQSYDWTTAYAFNGGTARVSLFEEDRHDALFSQTDTTVSPNLTQIENIQTVRIRGVETAFDAANVLVPGLDLSGSLTYADSAILADAQAPTAVGRQFPRIPRWRARLLVVYHQGDRLTYSLGYRYSSGAFSTLLNTDVNHDTYGGISSYSVLDAKVSLRIRAHLTASAGVDNLTNDKYYVSPHPYPQVTGFLGLSYDY